MKAKFIIAVIIYLLSFVLWVAWVGLSILIWPIWLSPIYAASLVAYPVTVFYILISAWKRLRKDLLVPITYYLWPLLSAAIAFALSLTHIAKRTP